MGGKGGGGCSGGGCGGTPLVAVGYDNPEDTDAVNGGGDVNVAMSVEEWVDCEARISAASRMSRVSRVSIPGDDAADTSPAVPATPATSVGDFSKFLRKDGCSSSLDNIDDIL